MTAVCKANATYEATCTAIDNLIPQSDITITASQSGNWSDTKTWAGRFPVAGDNVWIPNGITVTVDQVFQQSLRSIKANGLLTFASDRNSGLTVDTIVVGTDDNSLGVPQGELDLGSPAAPIAAGVTASLTFSNTGSLGSVFPNDPDQFCRGLVCMGTLSICGSQVTPWLYTTCSISAGVTSITLASAPVGWKTGDILLIPGTTPGVNQDEMVAIANVSGAIVTLSRPLSFGHSVSAAGQLPVVANTIRNIILASKTPGPTTGGHIMQCHNNAFSVQYASLLGLGRTDKSVPLNNAFVNGAGQKVPGTNQVGRYPFHGHRCFWPSINGTEPPGLVQGCYQTGSPGWGFTRHSSYMDMRNNVSYNNFGACFVDEAGDEIGTTDGNLAIRTASTISPQSEGTRTNDFWFSGEGFGSQSPGCTVTNNVALNCQVGFGYYTIGLTEAGLGVRQFWAAYAPSPQDFAGYGSLVPVDWVSIPKFSGNSVRGAIWALNFEYHQDSNIHLSSPTFVDSLIASDVNVGVRLNAFSAHVPVANSTLRGNGISIPIAPSTGILANAGYGFNIDALNTSVSGFQIGEEVSTESISHITGGIWDNLVNFLISREAGNLFSNRMVLFGGAITFGPHSQVNYQLTDLLGSFAGFIADFGVRAAFVPDNIIRPNGQQIYWPEQPASAIPFAAGFSTGPTGVPPQFVGLTNAQLFAQFGLAIGGCVAPASAAPAPDTNGLVGPPTSVPVWYWQMSPTTAPAGSSYTLDYYVVTNGVNGQYVVDPNPVVLQPGWNLIPRLGTNFLVYGTGSAPPPPANNPPTVATAAAASPNPVTATTSTALSVLGADDGGESNLKYTWTSTGPAAVAFSANATNAAKSTTATFTTAGSYTFSVAITDAGGLSVTSSVTVVVTVVFPPPSGGSTAVQDGEAYATNNYFFIPSTPLPNWLPGDTLDVPASGSGPSQDEHVIFKQFEVAGGGLEIVRLQGPLQFNHLAPCTVTDLNR